MKSSLTALLAIAISCLATASAGAQVKPADALPEVQQTQQASEPVRLEKTTAEFSTAVDQVRTFVQKHSQEQVLLVVDLDNTLLAMNQDLGSDQWFNWQESLLETDKTHADLVANSFPGLLDVQGVLFALSAMHPPEPDLPAMVNQLSKEGVTIVVLTSRGKEFRNSSNRELKRNEYDFAKSSLTIREKRGVFEPYDQLKPTDHGLSAEVIDQLGKPRSVTYSDGIYMTAGQHKGYMLQTLLARAVRNDDSDDPLAGFSAIVFVDDREKHTKRVHEAFENSSVDLATFRYSREDGNVERFKKSSKHHVVRDWNLLSAFTETVLVK